MSFTLKTYPEILDAMISHVKANSPITDINRGSVLRTILEAAALQDADQYVQIANILNTFSIDVASGTDLDNRADDFGLTRNQPSQSTGTVTIGDNRVTVKISSTLGAGVAAGVSQIQIQSADWSSFPNAGKVILDRNGPGTRETLAYASKTAPNLINLSAPTGSVHLLGASAVLSQQGVDHPLTSGFVVNVPASGTVGQLNFDTQASVVLYDGDVSVTVGALSEGAGTVQNVAIGSIQRFNNPPWSQATVTNGAPFTSGVDLETDQAFRNRIKSTIQSLSRATELAVQNAALSVVLPSGQRVVSAQLIEPIIAGQPVYLYIDDGNGLVTPSNTVPFNAPYTLPTGEVLSGFRIVVGHATLGQKRFNIGTFPIVPLTLSIYASSFQGLVVSFDGAQTYTVSDNVGGNPGLGVNALAGYEFVDANNHVYSIASNTSNTITLSTYSASVPPSAIGGLGWSAIKLPRSGGPSATPLANLTDFTLNETTGDFELSATSFPSGLAANQTLALSGPLATGYAFVAYQGLLQEVQKVINGVPSNLTKYPGVKAAGVKIIVLAPQVQLISVAIQIFSDSATDPTTLVAAVQSAIISYINSLGIGQEVVISEIIAAAMAIPGVTDAVVISPSTNPILLPGQLARTNSGLVQVV